MSARLLASGPGWSVSDIVCTAGPHDRPFEEWHESFCIAAVTQGTFRYRSSHGAALLAPGSVLLGNHATCFECSHEHGSGDRCVSFHFAPDHLEDIVAAVPGARRGAFATPRLPPLLPLLPFFVAAEGARGCGEEELEELALRFAGAVTAVPLESKHTAPRPSRRDERRVTDILRRIELEPHKRFKLAGLARDAGMSPYHFLRTFRQVVGMTPHQYVLRTRLHRAAAGLRQSDAPISTVALDAGFEDLSTFNRRFRRVMGATPRAYRTLALGATAAINRN